MTTDPRSRRLGDLKTLLDAERDAILAGDFDALTEIAERKQTCLRALASDRPSPAEVAALRRIQARNQAMLNSSGQGIKSVMRRLGELREAQNGLNTYSQTGRKDPLTKTSGRLEHKA